MVTLDQLFTRHTQKMPPGTMEANSLATILLHKRHFLRALGGRTAGQSVSTTTLQGYINERVRVKDRG